MVEGKSERRRNTESTIGHVGTLVSGVVPDSREGSVRQSLAAAAAWG